MATAGEERTPEPVLEREINVQYSLNRKGTMGYTAQKEVLLLLLWRIQLLEIVQSFQFSGCAADENVLCSQWATRPLRWSHDTANHTSNLLCFIYCDEKFRTFNFHSQFPELRYLVMHLLHFWCAFLRISRQTFIA